MKALADKISSFAFSSSLYRLTLMGPQPKGLNVIPTDPWLGDAGVGAKILAGALDAPHASVDLEKLDWLNQKWPTITREFLHGFTWLRDLHALGGAPARHQARRIIDDWIENCDNWHELVWDPAVLGTRICAWLNHYGFFGSSADEEFHAKTLESLSRQLRHLSRVVKSSQLGGERLTALKGLIYGTVCLAGYEERLENLLPLLEREIKFQVLSDGMHIERSPTVHVAVLRDLIEIRALLCMADTEPPEYLQTAITKMAGALKVLLHADGKLPLFNSSFEGEREEFVEVLDKATLPKTVSPSFKEAGFEKLSSGNTQVFIDTGAPSLVGQCAQSGLGSFEMDVDGQRVVINCGTYTGDDAAWKKAQRTAAAHTSVLINDYGPLSIAANGQVQRRPKYIHLDRDEKDGHTLVELNHDGFQKPLGLGHTRKFYLAEGGRDLRGEDEFVGGKEQTFVMRFHLYPSIQVTLLQNKQSALLKMINGKIWKFRSNTGVVSIEESIYLPNPGVIKRTQQLVVTGKLNKAEDTVVKWAFQEEAKN